MAKKTPRTILQHRKALGRVPYVVRSARDTLGSLTTSTGGRTFFVVRRTAGRKLEAIARQAPCQAAEWPILKASGTFFAIAWQRFATCNHLNKEPRAQQWRPRSELRLNVATSIRESI